MNKNDFLNEIYQAEKAEEPAKAGSGKTLNPILTVVTLVVFIGGMIFAVLVHSKQPQLSVMAIGVIFLYMGIMVLCTTKLDTRNFFILIFPIIGSAMVLIPAVNIWQKRHHSPAIPDDITFILIMVYMAVTGLIIVIGSIAARVINARVYTAAVEAECTELLSKRQRGKHGYHTLYCPVWKYTYAGKEYTSSENVYSNVNVPKVGETKEIYVDPDAPANICSGELAPTVLAVIVGGVFAAVALWWLISRFNA